MRERQKKQTREVVGLLGKIHEGIRKAIETRDYEEAMSLLARCQESAIELGESIEETEGGRMSCHPFSGKLLRKSL